jgi:hypothetical protein
MLAGGSNAQAGMAAASAAAAAAAAANGATGSLPQPGSLLMDLEDACPELQSLLSDLAPPDGGDIMFDARIVAPAGQASGLQAGSQQQQQLLQARPHLLIDPSSLRRLSSHTGQTQNLSAQQQHTQQQQQTQMWPGYMPYGDPIVKSTAAAAAAQHHHAGMSVMGPQGLRTALPDALTAQQYNYYYGQQCNQQYNQQLAPGGTTGEELTGSPKKSSPRSAKAASKAAKTKKRPQSRQKPNNKQRLMVAPGSPTLEGVVGLVEPVAMDGLEGLGAAAGEGCNCCKHAKVWHLQFQYSGVDDGQWDRLVACLSCAGLNTVCGLTAVTPPANLFALFLQQ